MLVVDVPMTLKIDDGVLGEGVYTTMCFQLSWSTELAGEMRIESFRNIRMVSSVLVFSKRQRKERRFLVLGMVGGTVPCLRC